VGSNPTLSARNYRLASVNFDRRVVEALGVGSVLATVFYIGGIVIYRSWGFWYLLTNLLLALVPLLLTYPLLQSVKRHGWLNVRSGLWGLVWLGFLPNSFYLLTDVMHLVDTRHGLPLGYAVVTFSLFGLMGLAVGFVSVGLVHRAWLRRLSPTVSYVAAETVLLLVSAGVYAGRTLRWNTWDVVLHPVPLARDVAVGLVGSGAPAVVMFFVLLSGLYLAIDRVTRFSKK
jgi:uncharacterized membrane protein